MGERKRGDVTVRLGRDGWYGHVTEGQDAKGRWYETAFGAFSAEENALAAAIEYRATMSNVEAGHG